LKIYKKGINILTKNEWICKIYRDILRRIFLKIIITKIYIVVILVFANSCISTGKINGIIDNNQLTLNYKHNIFFSETIGNSIINYYEKNKNYIYEIHINPSLMELIIFDTVSLTFRKYYYTRYFIDSNNNAIILLAPQKFNVPEELENIWKLYINDVIIDDEIIITNYEICFEETNNAIIVYNNNEKIIIIEK
jgi:hypothetical protein